MEAKRVVRRKSSGKRRGRGPGGVGGQKTLTRLKDMETTNTSNKFANNSLRYRQGSRKQRGDVEHPAGRECLISIQCLISIVNAAPALLEMWFKGPPAPLPFFHAPPEKLIPDFFHFVIDASYVL